LNEQYSMEAFMTDQSLYKEHFYNLLRNTNQEFQWSKSMKMKMLFLQEKIREVLFIGK